MSAETLVDGRPVANGARGRLRRRIERLLVSRGEREEADVERRLLAQPGVTRPNTVAVMSPKAGAGKTTCALLAGSVLARHLKLRVIAVSGDDPSRLAPARRRSEHSPADLLEHADRLRTAAELNPYVSRLPSGLHVLGADERDGPAGLGPDRYGELIAFLSCFYEVVLLDLGTGIAGPLPALAIERADQVVLVTRPEWIATPVVLEALSSLPDERSTVVINRSHVRPGDLAQFDARVRAEHRHTAVTIPHDDQLAAMLAHGTYPLEALAPASRLGIKRLGLTIANRLV